MNNFLFFSIFSPLEFLFVKIIGAIYSSQDEEKTSGVEG